MGSSNCSYGHTRTAFGYATICPWCYVTGAASSDLHIMCLSPHDLFINRMGGSPHKPCRVFSQLFHSTYHTPTLHRSTPHILLEIWRHVCIQLVVNQQQINSSLSDSWWSAASLRQQHLVVLRSTIIWKSYSMWSSKTAEQQHHALQRHFHTMDCPGPTAPLHPQG